MRAATAAASPGSIGGVSGGALRRVQADTSSPWEELCVYAGEHARSERDGQGAFTGVNRRKRGLRFLNLCHHLIDAGALDQTVEQDH